MSDEAHIASKFRRLIELRDTRDTTKTSAEEAEKEYREYESELFEELQDSPVKGARRIDLGEGYGVVRFTPRETVYGRILDADKAIDYFEQRGMLPSIAKQKISKARLNEIVKERIEQGEPMPEGVDWYANRGITITRPKGGEGPATADGGLSV